jgi:hypothetical protein
VADRSSQLLLQALSRAAAESEAVPLFAGRNSTGLFPNTSAGKQAAQRCQEEGYLLDAGKRGAVPLCTLSESGRSFLLGQVSPRQVLEDFVRVLEAREGQATQLIAQVRQMQTALESLRRQVEPVLDLVRRPDASLNGLCKQFHEETDLSHSVVEALVRWAESGSAEDCPLPELYRQCRPASLGSFHDVLRRLEAEGRVYLHPWTGPLYEIPEPSYALLVGHQVSYYASYRKDEG